MDFDSDQYDNSLSSDDQYSLQDKMSKTKQLHTKFFTDLNKQQKLFHRKNHIRNSSNQNNPISWSKKDFYKKKVNKRVPTFKQIIMTTKKYIQEVQSEDDIAFNQSKRKVNFKNQQQKSPTKKQRITSLEKMSTFNFCDAIKQMALELAQSKKQCNQYNQLQENSNQSLFSGYTEKQFTDGTKFKGICENGVITKGQLHFANDYVYDGELFLDKFHGKGKLILPKKQVIEGDWVEGKLVGKATIRYPKGQIYYGDIKSFRRHGKGHLFFKDGSKYEGQFTEGQLTGYGVYIDTYGQKNAGYWFYGDFVGNNEQIFENIMANFSAHQKKRTQKQNSKIKNMPCQRLQEKKTNQSTLNNSFTSNVIQSLFANFLYKSE